jgi:hypothetical protein
MPEASRITAWSSFDSDAPSNSSLRALRLEFRIQTTENAGERGDNVVTSSVWQHQRSIQKCKVLYCFRLAFGIHHYPVPAAQSDRRIVGVSDAPFDVDTWISQHRSPAPSLRTRIAAEDCLAPRPVDAYGKDTSSTWQIRRLLHFFPNQQDQFELCLEHWSHSFINRSAAIAQENRRTDCGED